VEITSYYFVLISVASVFIFYNLKQRQRILLLSLMSSGFIATYSFNLLIYVIIYSIINYYLALGISGDKGRKFLFRLGIVINLTQLILLKYVSFTINPLFELLGINIDIGIVSKIIIPVGVSFFTLQAIGYLINVYNRWEKPETSFVQFFLYISFFPRFLSGPIDRSNHFLPQLKREIQFDKADIAGGLRLLLFGFFKKIAIADQLAPIINSAYLNMETSGSSYSYWLILLLQPLYLYFDFSGYTDIAFGVARFFGITLRPNFNAPFLAENMTNFWKRFHISLSAWFHDYIFIRTSFRYRKLGVKASVFAILVTWILFGIWHGAGWTFMLLGVLQASAILYEFFTKRWRVKLFSVFPDYLRIWFGRLVTYMFYGTSLVFFFAPDLSSVINFFSEFPNMDGYLPGGVRTSVFAMSMLFAFLILLSEIIKSDFNKLYASIKSIRARNNKADRVFRWGLSLVMITVIMIFKSNVEQFIYFQF